MPSLPNDGFVVPDQPQGEERYKEWTLRWSGWQQGVVASGYALKKDGYWAAFRDGDRETVVSMVNGPTFLARDGDVLPECVGLLTNFPYARLAERAELLKAEARSRLLDRLDLRGDAPESEDA